MTLAEFAKERGYTIKVKERRKASMKKKIAIISVAALAVAGATAAIICCRKNK